MQRIFGELIERKNRTRKNIMVCIQCLSQSSYLEKSACWHNYIGGLALLTYNNSKITCIGILQKPLSHSMSEHGIPILSSFKGRVELAHCKISAYVWRYSQWLEKTLSLKVLMTGRDSMQVIKEISVVHIRTCSNTGDDTNNSIYTSCWG